MIVITGATGALNGATVDHLLERMDPAEIVVAVRDRDKAQRFAAEGMGVRQADYADPASLPTAFAGADQLLLVSASDPRVDAVALHRAAIEAAVGAGVGRILYTSHQGASPDTPFGPGRDHAATEALLADAGVPWTSLRNGFYAHSLGWLTEGWRESGVITVPVDGPMSWTAREDVAEAAAIILASDGAHDGPVTLTAGAAPTFVELAASVSAATGKHVVCQVVDRERWIADQVADGQPEFVARFLLGMYEAAEQGFFAGVDPALGQLLGRTPRTAVEAMTAPTL